MKTNQILLAIIAAAVSIVAVVAIMQEQRASEARATLADMQQRAVYAAVADAL